MTIEIGGEPRLCVTDEMLDMVAEAIRLKLNRQLNHELIEALDPSGIHVMTMLLLDHKACDETLPTHHRVSTLLKVRGTMHPVCVFLDVTDEWWQQRVTMAEYEAEREAEAEYEADESL